MRFLLLICKMLPTRHMLFLFFHFFVIVTYDLSLLEHVVAYIKYSCKLLFLDDLIPPYEENVGRSTKKSSKKKATKPAPTDDLSSSFEENLEYSAKKSSKKNATKPAPTKPLPGFIFFCNSKRSDILTQNPSLLPNEVGKKAGELWRELTDVEKQEWRNRSKRDFQEQLVLCKTLKNNAQKELDGWDIDSDDGMYKHFFV